MPLNFNSVFAILCFSLGLALGIVVGILYFLKEGALTPWEVRVGWRTTLVLIWTSVGFFNIESFRHYQRKRRDQRRGTWG